MVRPESNSRPSVWQQPTEPPVYSQFDLKHAAFQLRTKFQIQWFQSVVLFLNLCICHMKVHYKQRRLYINNIIIQHYLPTHSFDKIYSTMISQSSKIPSFSIFALIKMKKLLNNHTVILTGAVALAFHEIPLQQWSLCCSLAILY
mgnify:CR=1 FL=1